MPFSHGNMTRDFYPPVHYGLVSYPPRITPSLRQTPDEMPIPVFVHVEEFIGSHWKIPFSNRNMGINIYFVNQRLWYKIPKPLLRFFD